MFASFIPEIMDILGTRSKYGGSYKKEHGKRSGTVCALLLHALGESDQILKTHAKAS